jgi:hypothetical protein
MATHTSIEYFRDVLSWLETCAYDSTVGRIQARD